MAVPFSNTKLRVPRGFQNILEGLAREVLRNQPTDIYAFGAVYFEKLLKNRKGDGADPAQHGARMEDRFYNNQAFKKPDIDPSNTAQQDAALKIQTKYRQHDAKKVVQTKREEQAATKIQAGFRGHQDRERVKEMRKSGSSGHAESQPATDSPAEAQGTDEAVDIDINDPQVAAAATTIQAGFKGYKARKEVEELKEKKRVDQQIEEQENAARDIDFSDPEVAAAATKIQAGFKGYRTRQDLKKTQENQQSQATKQDQAAENTDNNHKKQEENEEVVDIDLNDPEVEKAAVKIQAGFKGFKARKEVNKNSPKAQDSDNLSTQDLPPPPPEEEIDIDLDDPEVEQAAIKIQAGFKKFKSNKESKKDDDKSETNPSTVRDSETGEHAKQEEEIDIDLNDPEVEQAAIKIQAGFKKFKSNKEEAGVEKQSPMSAQENAQKEEEEIDIDLNDPEVEQAAIKIQAGFKKFKTSKAKNEAEGKDEEEKKEVKGESQGQQQQQEVAEEIDIDLNDPEVEKAAVKIQAGFKGYKTRKSNKPDDKTGN